MFRVELIRNERDYVRHTTYDNRPIGLYFDAIEVSRVTIFASDAMPVMSGRSVTAICGT